MRSKLIIIITGSLALSGLSLSALADDKQKGTKPETKGQIDTSKAYTPERFGTVEKASKILGAEVKNVQDEKLGKIQEMAVDIEGGRIVAVILSVGGFLGVGDRHVAVPPSALTGDTEHAIRLDADKARLKAAPEFELSKWDTWATQPQHWSECYRHFGATPYFGTTYEPGQKPSTSRASLGHVEKASKIIGASVKNNQDENIGKVDNLMVDLPAGRLVEVIVAAGGFLGLGDQLTPIPPTAFRRGVEREVLLLDATKEMLTKAPHLKAGEFPDTRDRAAVVEVYRYYRVEPYFDTGDAKVVERETRTVTPLDQTRPLTDTQVTANIRSDIGKRKDFSANAQNVKITTRDGKVVLVMTDKSEI
jgi:sporulation protein YlmC with PRC-barrel domain